MEEMKFGCLCPRKYGDVKEMIRRSDEAMKQSEDFMVRIEGTNVYVNREPKTPEENMMLYAACVKAIGSVVDSLGRRSIEEGLE